MRSLFAMFLTSRVLWASAFIVCFTQPAAAGSLTMVGEGGIDILPNGQEYRVKGVYTIENRGDETAKEVFPQFRIGQWTWSGTPKTIPAGKKDEWEVDLAVNAEVFQCRETEPCGQLKMALRGAYPLFILRHYQDLNGYRFSAADLKRVVLGDLSAQEIDRIQVPGLEARAEILRQDGKNFDVQLTIMNLSDKPIRAAITTHTSREIRTVSQPSIVDVAPEATEVVQVSWENFSGLEGSGYASFALLQWDDGGLRNFLPTGSMLILARPSMTPYYAGGAVVASLLFLLAVVVALRRPARVKTRS